MAGEENCGDEGVGAQSREVDETFFGDLIIASQWMVVVGLRGLFYWMDMRRRVLIYLGLVGILTVGIALLANFLGIRTIAVKCPQGVMDCGDGRYYLPLFWWPVKFIFGDYFQPAWPAFDFGWLAILVIFGYWFFLANITLLVGYLLRLWRRNNVT